MNLEEFERTFAGIRAEVSRAVVGQSELIEQVLIALIARGHVLLEGVPGVGKTLLVRTLAQVIAAQFKRIQFTPDLMPTDVTGGNVFDSKRGEFVFMPGPIFTQLLLADEVNRAPAKTQSALLEAMQDGTVTADGVSRPLPQPFLVIATQNPVESQGTYPLPEAQLDRFLLKLLVSHPKREVEKQILKQFVEGFDTSALDRSGIRQVTTAQGLLEMQQFVKSVRVDDSILDYVTDIVSRTRSHSAVYLGSSPRGALGLLAVARAHAASQGRDFVIPDDVKAYAAPALRHRLILQPDAELSNIGPDECVESVLKDAKVPKGVG